MVVNDTVIQDIRRDLQTAKLSCRGDKGRAAVQRVHDNIEYLYTQFILDSEVNYEEEIESEPEDML